MMKEKEITKKDFDCKNYLEYIDKEITFCGIITTFCLAAILFMLDKMFGKQEQNISINDFKSGFFIFPIILLFLAAYLLYQQRSKLAFCYGQISYEYSFPGKTDKSIEKWFEFVDSWGFWKFFCWAEGIIFIALFEIVIFILISIMHGNFNVIYFNNYSFWTSLLIIIIGLICNFLNIRRLRKETDKKKLPHYKVYTRISVSQVHNGGVGVVAILDIPKDEFIFYPDDDEIFGIKQDEIEKLPDEIKKLYKDFCVQKGDTYLCPKNFNQLTPAWYLNNSKNPNVYCDENLRFKANRDIKAGEELTSNYSQYSDNE